MPGFLKKPIPGPLEGYLQDVSGVAFWNDYSDCSHHIQGQKEEKKTSSIPFSAPFLIASEAEETEGNLVQCRAM